MEKPCIRLQFHFTSERPVRCVAMLPIISSPFRVSRTSRSWKAKRLSAISSRDACRVAQHFSTGSSATRRNPANRQIYIPSNRHPARQLAEDFRVVTAGRAKQDERSRTNGRARPPGAPSHFHKSIGEILWVAHASRPALPERARPRDRGLCCDRYLSLDWNLEKRSFRRDAESPSRTGICTRDACATPDPAVAQR